MAENAPEDEELRRFRAEAEELLGIATDANQDDGKNAQEHAVSEEESAAAREPAPVGEPGESRQEPATRDD
jgi:hypothetical protein